jgi:uncharacterized membrane protein YfcA
MSKTFIWIGVFIGSSAGGWLGALAANGNWLSWQSLLGTAVGSFLGVYVGFKASQYFF